MIYTPKQAKKVIALKITSRTKPEEVNDFFHSYRRLLSRYRNLNCKLDGNDLEIRAIFNLDKEVPFIKIPRVPRYAYYIIVDDGELFWEDARYFESKWEKYKR